MKSRFASFQHNMMSMMMNMAAVTAATLLLLCCSVFASKDSQAKCDMYVETNKDIDVPLNLKLDKTQRLKWKHNEVVIFDRDGTSLIEGKEGDVTENGSLRLKKVPKSKEGTYKPEVFTDGRAVPNLKSTKLCVIDPLPSLTMKVECTSKDKVKFTCGVGQAKNLKIEWFKNTNVLEKDVNKTYIMYKAEDVEKDEFRCKVSNAINNITSQPVKQNCFTSGFVLPEEIWGINTWVLVGIGGGVVLLLIIVVIACCICNRRKKRMQVKDEEELRLGWTNSQPQHSHQYNHPPGQHQHHHHHHHQQQPAGHTGPRQHRSRQQRNHPLPRTPDQPNGQPQPSPRRAAQAPPPVNNCDDEQPPPLPQPRKKAPKTPRA